MAYHLKHKPEKWVNKGRILCIDHGTKTLGFAISNASQTVVTPMETIHRKKWSLDREKISRFIQDYDISIILVGYPLNMDGSKGARCQSVNDFVFLLEEAWPSLTFFFFDERLSTQAVDKFLDKDMSKTRTKRKVFKDALAAQVILDEALHYLNLRKNLNNDIK